MKTILFCLTILISASSKAHEETWLLDSRFVTADIHSILQTEYPELKANIASLYNQASYYSINPFLLAEIVKNTNANAINITAKKLFAEIRKKITSIHAKARLAAQKVMEKYNLSQKPNKATQSNMPALDVPFNHNQSWAFNGVHTWKGNDDGTPMSSLDLAKSWSIHWGGVTSDIWVAAAHGGIATVFSSCYIRITHASGWATDYYVGNRDFEQWRTDESKTLDLLQTSGGNFNQLQAIDFATDAVIAGSMTLQFIDCNHVAINFSLNEPTTGQTIAKELLLTKALGLPDSVCNATSLSYN